MGALCHGFLSVTPHPLLADEGQHVPTNYRGTAKQPRPPPTPFKE